MLTILGQKQKFCDGVTRRNFLKIGAFGAGLTLADLLRSQASAGSAAKAAKSTANKAAIMIYLPGGPTHMDTWDLKPEAPAEYRGEFKPIKTNAPGLEICELFPRLAEIGDKFSLIRSIVSIDEHSDSLVMTGWGEGANRNVGHPSFGSAISKLRGMSQADIPPFVSLRGMGRGTEPGYLGVAHRPFTPDGAGFANLRLPGQVSTDRLDDRKSLLASFDQMNRDVDASGTMAGLDSFTSRAFDLVTSGTIRNALDLSREDPRIRDRYGKSSQQLQFLTARRLVEAGVGCVTLSIGGWDTHGDNFKTMRRQLPEVDQSLSALVDDLSQRGLDKDVSVIMWGEFGRTPRINGGAGRDHWAPVMSAFVAGGGLKMGQVVGSSSARGEYPKDRRVSVQNVLATLYHGMGIDASMTFNNGSGRPMHLLEDREKISELI